MDFSDYAGLIEFFLVISFVLGWGILELVGLRMDKRREAEKVRRDAGAPADTGPRPSSESARHTER